MFERLLIDNLGEIGFIVGPMVRHNVYKSPELLSTWSGDAFNAILISIKRHLSTTKSGEKKQPLLPVTMLEKAVLDTPNPTRNFLVMSSVENIDQPIRDAIRKQPEKDQTNGKPAQCRCPKCNELILTIVKRKANLETWKCCMALFMSG
jgi:hypothetical protein